MHLGGQATVFVLICLSCLTLGRRLQMTGFQFLDCEGHQGAQSKGSPAALYLLAALKKVSSQQGVGASSHAWQVSAAASARSRSDIRMRKRASAVQRQSQPAIVSARSAPPNMAVSLKRLSPNILSLNPTAFSNGSMGSVFWAQYGASLCVAKQAAPTQRAEEFLAVEGNINRLLQERGQDNTHLAPFLGQMAMGGSDYLLWHACGRWTLDMYLGNAATGHKLLARALACRESEVPMRVLRDVLTALAHIHTCGIVHRDIKPANLLIDEENHCVRLIDFGSSCDVAGWFVRSGLRPNRVPCSPLYCAPEMRLDERNPYAYDVYSAALIWMALAEPQIGCDENALYDLRIELRDHDHNPGAWRRNADASPGPGWEATFGWPGQEAVAGNEDEVDEADLGAEQHAWRLLTSMLDFDPAQRPTAAAALLGPYLNADCSAEEVPLPALEPWSLEALLNIGSPSRKLEAEQCTIPDSYLEVSR
mmetsp:Transcript_142162/g.250773  ORF Transcript_142162/g.250773 Transcript_142162/m.250773 type:complete len:478 (-) Transcript_142162:423-1856(-)